MSNPSSSHQEGSAREQPPNRFFGKYRGIVQSNVDPMKRGRILAQVPEVSVMFPGNWAEPCFPSGGIQYGMVSIPAMGAGVWIEYEQGDPNKPIWTGVFYGSTAEMPTLANTIPPGVMGMAMATPAQNAVVINDTPGTGGILIQAGAATFMMNETGITIQNGQGASITMSGPNVNINAGALSIT